MKALFTLALLFLASFNARSAEVMCTEPAYRIAGWTQYTQRCYDLGVLDSVPSESCAAVVAGVRRPSSPVHTQTTCYFRLAAMSTIEVHASGSATGRNSFFYLQSFMPGLPAPEQWDGYTVYRNLPATGDGPPHRFVMLSSAGWVGSGRVSYGATLSAQ